MSNQLSNGLLGRRRRYNPSAPIALTVPVITGVATVGGTLTTTVGTWTGNPMPTFAIAWKRNGAVISGATGSTYSPVAADAGATLTVTITATNSAGSGTATSAATSAVTWAPANTVAPVISGTARVGQTLTTTNGTWTGYPAPTYTRVWKRNGVAIAGATGTSYVLVAADASATITVTVTATNSVGTDAATSAGTSAVTWIPANTALPTISGTPAVDEVLTASSGTWTGYPAPTYGYVWKRNGAAISGATSSTYTVVEADAATTLTVTVTATNSAGSGNATSAGAEIPALADPTFTWIGQAQSGTVTSYSPNLNGLGADYAERYLLVAVYWARVGTSNSNLTGAKLNGVDVTPIVNTPSSPGGMCLYIIKAPTGGSVSSNFTFSNFVTVTLTWSVLTDLQSMAPISTGKATANNPSVNVSIPNKGIAFGYWACGYGTSPGTNSWSSPMTMDLNNTISTQFRISVGHRIAASDIASYNVQHFFNYSGSLVAASFR